MTTRADPLRHLTTELVDLRERGLLRTPPEPLGRGLPADLTSGALAPVNLCSNDYLGYAQDPWPVTDEPIGAGASRLVTGEHRAHLEAETEISAWLGAEATLLFTSGYAANTGALAALARPGDLIISDALNHASIIDGSRLSGAKIIVVPHLDVEAIDRALTAGAWARSRWVVTESYFSMDGDTPDLRALRTVCDARDAALYVDEAHAVGVFGPAGRGLCAAAGVVPEVLVGTLGKALGLQGAFVSGRAVLRHYLWNRARSFVFSTGMSPALAGRVSAQVRRAAKDEAGRERLRRNVKRLREGLLAVGVEVGGRDVGLGPILPWVVGGAAEAVGISRRLRERGIVVQAIRPPTVPVGTARLRITATARLTDGELERVMEAFRGLR